MGRHLGLAVSNTTARRGGKSNVAEKKRIRKELERLRKIQNRAMKALDEWEVSHPAAQAKDDEEEHSSTFPVAAARIPDATGFPGFPTECTPGMLILKFRMIS